MGLDHNFLYISSDKYYDDIWRDIQYHPLRLENEPVSEIYYVDIHDDFINYFNDFFEWIEMYNPSKKEKIYGLCHYGVTVIKNENLKKMAEIIDSIISLFKNSPKNIKLTGMYTNFVEDIIDGKEILTDGHYEIMKIRKDKFMEKILKLKNIVKKQSKKMDILYIWEYKIINMEYAPTSHNRLVNALLTERATKKRSQPNGFCAFFFRHIFAVAKSLRLFSSQPQKRHLQPERYVKYGLK